MSVQGSSTDFAAKMEGKSVTIGLYMQNIL